MISLFLFEKDPLVRVDIIDLIESCFTDISLNIYESYQALVADLSVSRTKSVVLFSGTTQEIRDFFSGTFPKSQSAFVVLGDSEPNLPEDYAISTVARPFNNDMLINGIKSALSFLHSFH